jgi:lipoprotein NlpI
VLKPEVTGFYIKRAQARLYSGQVNAAITDLNAALRLDPSDAYAVIWLHLAHLQGRVDDMQEMRQAAAVVDRNKWPGAIVGLFLGTSEPETVNAAGPANADRKSRSERECQAAFYLGIFKLEKGDRTGAKDHLQAAADTCPSSLIELATAKAELKRLNSRR